MEPAHYGRGSASVPGEATEEGRNTSPTVSRLGPRRRIGSPMTPDFTSLLSSAPRVASAAGSGYFPCPPPIAGESGTYGLMNSYQTLSSKTATQEFHPPVKLLEELNIEQLSKLLEFLPPPGLSCLERSCSQARRLVNESINAWQNAFFNSLPHMYEVAEMHVAGFDAEVHTPSNRLRFPFATASGNLYKAFLAYEHGTRHWLLCTEILQSIQRCSSATCNNAINYDSSLDQPASFEAGLEGACMCNSTAFVLRSEATRCMNTIRKCQTTLDALSRRRKSADESAVLDWFGGRLSALWNYDESIR